MFFDATLKDKKEIRKKEEWWPIELIWIEKDPGSSESFNLVGTPFSLFHSFFLRIQSLSSIAFFLFKFPIRLARPFHPFLASIESPFPSVFAITNPPPVTSYSDFVSILGPGGKKLCVNAGAPEIFERWWQAVSQTIDKQLEYTQTHLKGTSLLLNLLFSILFEFKTLI